MDDYKTGNYQFMLSQTIPNPTFKIALSLISIVLIYIESTAQRFVYQKQQQVVVRQKVTGTDLSLADETALQLAAKIEILREACFLESLPLIDNIVAFSRNLERRGSSLSDFVKFYYPNVAIGFENIVFEPFQSGDADKKEWSGKMEATCTCRETNATGQHEFKTPIEKISNTKKQQLIYVTNLKVALASIGQELNRPPSRISTRMLKMQVPGYVSRKYGRKLNYSTTQEPEIVESIEEGKSKVITYATYLDQGEVRTAPLKKFGISYSIGVDQVKNIFQQENAITDDFLSFSSDMVHQVNLRFMSGELFYLGIAVNLTSGTSIQTATREWAYDESMMGLGLSFGTIDYHFNPSIQVNYRTLSVEDDGSFELLGLGAGIDFSRKNIQFGLSYRMDMILAELGTLTTNTIYDNFSEFPQKSIGNFSLVVTKYF